MSSTWFLLPATTSCPPLPLPIRPPSSPPPPPPHSPSPSPYPHPVPRSGGQPPVLFSGQAMALTMRIISEPLMAAPPAPYLWTICNGTCGAVSATMHWDCSWIVHRFMAKLRSCPGYSGRRDGKNLGPNLIRHHFCCNHMRQGVGVKMSCLWTEGHSSCSCLPREPRGRGHYADPLPVHVYSLPPLGHRPVYKWTPPGESGSDT